MSLTDLTIGKEHVIAVKISPEGVRWVAQALDVDVSSFGDTREEAIAAIQEALELYFEDEEDMESPQRLDGL